ncbi:MAG TPA: hypothetical protein VFY18_11230, partial [Candidatus Limnocylindrales bacterium]|nr:hypothetical protein [Candidatus Limnocylindrales bacterium]
KASPRTGRLAVVAVVVLLGVGLGAAALVYLQRPVDPLVGAGSSPDPSSAPRSSTDPTSRPTHRVGLAPQPPVGTPRPIDRPATASLPVRGSGRDLGTRIQLAPGAAGDLFVSVPAPGARILVTLVDAVGRSRPGWPIVLDRTTSCDELLPVEDGSVRLLCTPDNRDGSMTGVVRAHAFDASGNALPGWPIDLDRYGADGSFAERVIGDELTFLAWKSLGAQIEAGKPAGHAWIVAIAADGTVAAGSKVSYGIDCCIDTWAIGPDGVAYGTVHHFADTRAGAMSELVAIGPTGVPDGFPITIVGSASQPAFDAAGLIHLTVGTPNERPSGTLVFDGAGRTTAAGSGELDVAATSEFLGIEGTGSFPVAPLVGRDGVTYLIDLSGGATTVAGLDPSGRAMTGWPYRSDLGPQRTRSCRAGDGCEGSAWAAPAAGPDNVLYLVQAATSSSVGGSIVAVGQDGVVVDGWPVGLRRAGSEAWSVVVGPDGNASVLAVEPEPNGSHSATILSLAPDSSVRYTLTVVEP